MPSWFAGVVGTFGLSVLSAYGFLRLRCRRAGRPFGPRAKWWSMTIILLTAIVSTGLGVAVVAVSGHIRAAYIGLALPSGLWFGQASRQRRRQGPALWRKPLAALVTLPFRRLYDRMGDDMQEWCNARLDAASRTPQQICDAAIYYFNQVGNRLRPGRDRDQLSRWRESIEHKTSIVRLISLDTTPARLQAALQWHPSTRDWGGYAADDLPRLADRLENEAQNELYLFLAQAYRLGFRKLLIYPLRPAARISRRGPLAGRQATADLAWPESPAGHPRGTPFGAAARPGPANGAGPLRVPAEPWYNEPNDHRSGLSAARRRR